MTDDVAPLPPDPDDVRKPSAMRSGADLERASRIRQGKRVDFTTDEDAERQRLLVIYRDSSSTREQIGRALLRLAELDYGARPRPIPAWVGTVARRTLVNA